jgi:NADH-quinone oxidoreductase subunit J
MVYLMSRGEPSGAVGEITSEVVQSVGHTELIGRALFIDFLLPFEITSILLLVAMIGAVVLAKRTV